MKTIISMSVKNFLIISSLVYLSSCATIFGEHTRTVSVDSNQANTEIFVNNISVGTTPAQVTLPRYIFSNQEIVLKKSGFSDAHLPINTVMSAATVWNMFNGGIGFLIDAATGDIMRLSPYSMNVYANMQKTTESK